MTLAACIGSLGRKVCGNGLPIDTRGTKIEQLLVRVQRPSTTSIRGLGDVGANGRASSA